MSTLAAPFTVISWALATSALTFCSDSSRSHGHSHPTVSHSAVGPMYAMGTPAHSHHQQASDGTTEKKKKKEERDREKHEKDKEKVGLEQTSFNSQTRGFTVKCQLRLLFVAIAVTCLAVTRSYLITHILLVTHVFSLS